MDDDEWSGRPSEPPLEVELDLDDAAGAAQPGAEDVARPEARSIVSGDVLTGQIVTAAPAGVAPVEAAAATAEEEAELQPLDSPRSGFLDFAAALAALLAHTSYYQVGHPEFDKSLSKLAAVIGAPLRGRRELAFVRHEERRHEVEVMVQSGDGARLTLGALLGRSRFSGLDAKLVEVFQRRHLVSLALREGIDAREMADVMELLAGPEASAGDLRDDYHARALEHVSILFADDLLGHARKLPWTIDVCVSRLARDLLSLPRRCGADRRRMDALGRQLVADVVRPLRPPDLQLLLRNVDLVRDELGDTPELAGVDLERLVVEALPHRPCLALATATLDELEREVAAEHEQAAGPGSPRRLMQLIGDRFVRDRAVESDEVLRELHSRAIVSFPELPDDLRQWIQAEQLAETLTRNPEPMLRSLATVDDLESYAMLLDTLQRTLTVLARRARVAVLWRVVDAMRREAGDAEPGESSRQALAARAVRTLDDPDLVTPLVQALLTGDRSTRDPAHALCVVIGRRAAQELVDQRRALDLDPPGRARFVAALGALGDVAYPALYDALSLLPHDETGAASLAEDLLRCAAGLEGEELAQQARRFMHHREPGVRRAAVAAMPALCGARARRPLLAALGDKDDGVRLAGLTGLQHIGAVDGEVVERIEPLLAAGVNDEVGVTAAAVLGKATAEARSRTVEVLHKALSAGAGGFFSRLRGGTPPSPAVAASIATSLLATGGAEGRKLVEKVAAQSKGELAAALQRVLG